MRCISRRQFVLPLCLVGVLIAPDALAEGSSAWAPWWALEGATEAKATSFARTEKLLGLGRAFILHRRPNSDVERLTTEMEKRVSVLDAASFYELLGRGQTGGSGSRWFELEGRLQDTHYPLKAWRRAPRPDAFGELNAHFGLRPTERKGGFVLETALRGDLGDLRFDHVAAFAHEVLAWLETTRADPGGELARAFPRTAPLVERHARVRAELSPGEHGTRVRLFVGLSPEKVEEDFPHLADTLRRLRGLADAEVSLRRGSAELAHVSVDSEKLLTTIELTIDAGRLVPTIDGRPSGDPIDVRRLERLDYDVASNLHSNVSGLKLSVENLVAHTRFRKNETNTRWRTVLNEIPNITADGGFGIIPLWMIDALIPSDVETLATDFFRTMVEGNGGAGLVTQVSMPAGAGGVPYEATAEAELLSNGFLTFCLRVAMSSMGDRNALKRDIARMWSNFLDAFEADLGAARG